jgi:hypothetical protein
MSVLRRCMVQPSAELMNNLLQLEVLPQSHGAWHDGNCMSDRMIARAIASHAWEDKMFVVLLFIMQSQEFRERMLQHEPADARLLLLLYLEETHEAWMKGYYLDRTSQTRCSLKPHTPRHLQTYGWMVFETRAYYLRL